MYPTSERRMVKKYVVFEVTKISGNKEIQTMHFNTSEKTLRVEVEIIKTYIQ
jgi:hypothetical protein